MQVSVVASNGLERRLEVTVPGELVTHRVEQRLKDLARTARLKAIFTPVERAAEATDRVTVALEGRIDGEIFPGGEIDELKVVLGAGTVLPELDAALRGMQAGEEKEVPARFPDDYGAKAVAGKDAVFKLWPKRVESQSLPELDEAFLRDLCVAEGRVSSIPGPVRNSHERH